MGDSGRHGNDVRKSPGIGNKFFNGARWKGAFTEGGRHGSDV